MSKWGFDKVLRNIEEMKRDLPKVLANDALRYFNDTFVKSEWDGVKWQTPQRKIAGTKAYKYPKKGANARHTRATLVKSGRLRRDVRSSLKLATFDKIRFEVRLPYAAVHNYGLKMKNGRNMPTRKFMGQSKALSVLQKQKINLAIKKIWQA